MSRLSTEGLRAVKNRRLYAAPGVKLIALTVVVMFVGMSIAALAPDGVTPARHCSESGSLLDLVWIAEGNQTGANFGNSVASAGDVNGDGYDDVIVGAHNYNGGNSSEGRAFLYLGSSSGLSTLPSWTAESDQSYARFGFSVSSAGDVNNDGFADVIVSAYAYDGGEFDEGRVFLYLGSFSGLSASPVWTVESDQAYSYSGNSVASAGDVNGDGYDDVLVAFSSYDNDQMDEGLVHLYLGSASGPSAAPSWTSEGNQSFAYYGRSVASAGDVNNDGYDDVIIGAYYYDNGEDNEGSAFLYLGSSSGLSSSPSWIGESNQKDAWFGGHVASAGDINNDGFDDVLVGAVGYDNPETYEGRAYLYLGSASGLSASPAWTGESDNANAYYGVVSSAGDINNDGYSDVIVGSYLYTNDTTEEGRVFLYLGSASGLSTSYSWTAEGDEWRCMFGSTVSSAGDVNGDGADEIIIGSYDFENGEPHEGCAYVYSGLYTPPPPTRFDLALVAGWNLVTVPLVNHGYMASTLGLAVGDVVAGWNPATQSYDRNFVVGISPPPLDFTINPSEGYWVYTGATRTLELYGETPTAPQTRSIVVPATGGFAIIGITSLDATLMASDVPGMYSGGSITVVDSWNAAASTWWAYYPGLPFTDYPLTPGLAAFIWCTESGTFSYTP
ncbi:MAG: FG-GAP repeat protein [Candidatus Thermoplasmatota archaeon]|nr:FG-GAP repeat protein [Candidatus Thermoplasmatota archaeon]